MLLQNFSQSDEENFHQKRTFNSNCSSSMEDNDDDYSNMKRVHLSPPEEIGVIDQHSILDMIDYSETICKSAAVYNNDVSLEASCSFDGNSSVTKKASGSSVVEFILSHLGDSITNFKNDLGLLLVDELHCPLVVLRKTKSCKISWC